MVMTLNGSTGESHQVINPDRSGNQIGVYGVPTFWGDDDAVTIQWLDGSNGSVDRVPIDANFAGPADSGYVSDGRVTSSLNDYAAAMPMMHRRAVRSVSGALTLSAQSITFENTAVGTQASQNLTLTNSSARDIRILDISLSGAAPFSHNGTNGLMPRGSQTTIAVTYTPTADGLVSATLSITSDADAPTTTVSITGNTGNSTTSGDGDSSGGGSSDGGGGGCMIGLLYSEILGQ